MPRRLAIAIALLLTACGSRDRAAPPPPPPPTPPAPTKLDALAVTVDGLAAEAAATQHAAGISVAVVWRGETVLAKGYGLADAEHQVAVDADTVFRIGSITKQFTAAAIVRLAAAGRLGYDDLLVRHLPAYPTHDRPITLRHLLHHTSGIADYEHGAWLAAHMEEDRPLDELIATFAAAPFDFAPGAEWSYSNSGYVLLGQIVEQLTHHALAAELDAIIAAAGVTGVRWCPDEQTYPHAARGYVLAASGAATPARPIRMAYAGGAGAMCATASGLVAWARALAGGRVVDAAGWREMITPAPLTGGGHYDYGFGLFTGTLGDHRVIFHNGGINGFSAKLSSYPDDDLYVAVLSNLESGDADALDAAIGRAVLGVPAPPPPQDLPVDAAELAQVVGRYEIAVASATIAIEADGGKLFVLQDGHTGRAALHRQPDGGYTVDGEDGLIIRFVRDRDRVTSLSLEQAGMTFPGKRLGDQRGPAK